MGLLRVGLVMLVSVAAALGAASFGNAQDAEELEKAEYAGVKLFSIPYGSEDKEVGFALLSGEEYQFQATGPGHIKVDRHGNVWLWTGAQVKAFGRDGTLLRVVGRIRGDDTEQREEERSPLEHVELVRTYAVDGRGYVYLVADRPLTHLFVINEANRVVESDRDEYGNLVQVRGEEKMLWQLQRQFGHELAKACISGLGGPSFMCADEADHLYLLARAPVQNKERRGTETCFYEFTPDLEFVGTVPGFYMGPDGYTYEFAAGNTPENVRLHTYDREGHRVGTRRLIRPEGPWTPCPRPVFDWAHNIYLPCRSGRAKPVVVMPGFEIRSDYVVYKYNAEGELLGKFKIPKAPIYPGGVPSPIAVDQDENMYYLNFRPSSVEVMIVETKNGPAGTTPP